MSVEEVESASVESRRPTGALGSPLVFAPGTWRAVAKIACNMLGYRRRSIFMDAAFDEVRRFVLDGGDPWSFVGLTAEPLVLAEAPNAIGPLDHVIIVRSDPSSGEVNAVVALYAHLQFFVRLGKATTSLPVCTSYRVDPISRGHRLDHDLDRKLDLGVMYPMTAETLARWQDDFECRMRSALAVAEVLGAKRARIKIIQEAYRAAHQASGGRPFDESQKRVLVETIARGFVETMGFDPDEGTED